MNRAFIKHISLCLVLSTGLGLIVSSPNAEARRKYTITNRINTLSAKINAGQKSNELTLKEADGLRGDISDINEKIAKDKSKNGGKLSYADENNIEKKLNSVSQKLQKKELAKRAARPND